METSDFEIDEYSLEKEWIRQPILFMEYAAEANKAQAERDRLKAQLDLVQASMDLEVRNDPELYGITKVTETVVANVVIRTAKYQKAQKAYFDAREKHGVLDKAITALEHKKKALESLVSLFAMNYYSEPKDRNATKQEHENVKGRVARKLNRHKTGDE